MTGGQNLRRNARQPPHYQIRLRGHLNPQWSAWFDGMTITLEESGDTLLTGPVVDQAALHGLLKKVRDLGMPLLAVAPVDREVDAHGTSPDTGTKTGTDSCTENFTDSVNDEDHDNSQDDNTTKETSA